jgi:hypothetical protein
MEGEMENDPLRAVPWPLETRLGINQPPSPMSKLALQHHASRGPEPRTNRSPSLRQPASPCYFHCQKGWLWLLVLQIGGCRILVRAESSLCRIVEGLKEASAGVPTEYISAVRPCQLKRNSLCMIRCRAAQSGTVLRSDKMWHLAGWSIDRVPGTRRNELSGLLQFQRMQSAT